MIIDQVRIHLKAGKGGDGASTFIKKGNTLTADGGSGGKGGDIIIRTNENFYDLSKFKYKKKFVASSGEGGRSRNKTGKNAPPLYIDVPQGTIIKDTQERILVDLKESCQEFLAARGGSGGKGNFKRKFYEKGSYGEEKDFICDYRVPCEVALVGFANVGKTSLFNRLSGQSRRVAAYPFTTTFCSWAVCEHELKRFTLLDTPPLKATEGVSSGEQFLKHIFRTLIIIVVQDNLQEYEKERRRIKEKLSRYDRAYLKKIFFYLLNKIDKIERDNKKEDVIWVSAEKGWGIEDLKEKILSALSS